MGAAEPDPYRRTCPPNTRPWRNCRAGTSRLCLLPPPLAGGRPVGRRARGRVRAERLARRSLLRQWSPGGHRLAAGLRPARRRDARAVGRVGHGRVPRSRPASTVPRRRRPSARISTTCGPCPRVASVSSPVDSAAQIAADRSVAFAAVDFTPEGDVPLETAAAAMAEKAAALEQAGVEVAFGGVPVPGGRDPGQ